MALAHAILASLVECPCSGYDLAKRFDGSVGFFWVASHQQIYRELPKLEELGWIESEAIAQFPRPDKKLYYITELGKQQLREWIDKPCEPTLIKDDLLVKIFAGYVVNSEKILEQIEYHEKAHRERLLVYKQIEQQYFQLPIEQMPESEKFRYLTLLNGINYETYWLAWCKQAIELLEK
jgi:DNA-binding PadR family transcriptional regulator